MVVQYMEPQDHGWMYDYSFADLDGYYKFMYMDENASLNNYYQLFNQKIYIILKCSHENSTNLTPTNFFLVQR
jgi:hypothetical protein